MTHLSYAIPITDPNPEVAVQQWFTLLGELCAGIDYDTAEGIFADDVVSFGTRADIVTGLGNLRRNQWEGIWGNIADFKGAEESILGFGDQDVAWGGVTWTSTGFDEDHKPFVRPGRPRHRDTGPSKRNLARNPHPLLPESRNPAKNVRTRLNPGS